jgi:hypothetical protein
VVHKAESIFDAASRKLESETGLLAQFRLVGMERRILYKEDALFSDVLFPLCYSDAFEGELLEETEYGEHVWSPIDVAIDNETRRFDSIVSLVPVLEAIADRSIDTFPFSWRENTQKDK